MDIEINTKITKEIDKIKVLVEAPEFNEQVDEIISKLNVKQDTILAKEGGKIYFIKIEEILQFYSLGKIIFLKTREKEYETGYRLYELEDILPKNKFIRISHACIVNKDKIEYFDVNITGEILVKLKDGTTEYVSKRRIKDIMNIIKGGK